MLEKSIIIAAHPDDEILWFSSIFNKVDRIIVCYLAIESKPDWTTARTEALSKYPKENIISLSIDESGFNGANWSKPIITPYGLGASKKSMLRNRTFQKKYIESYRKLKNELKNRLAGFSNVFTHNPWGEYGNADHVQVYRVVKELQQSMKFDIWFSNYTAPLSNSLMLSCLSSFNTEQVSLKTDKPLLEKIKEHYIKYKCWSWFDDWEGFDDETFFKDEHTEVEPVNGARALPLNLIKLT